MTTDHVLAEIAAERRRQVEKWGTQSHLELSHWALILAEEAGEVAKELCKIEVPPAEVSDRAAGIARARAELIQTAAVAVAMIEHIDTGETDRPYLVHDATSGPMEHIGWSLTYEGAVAWLKDYAEREGLERHEISSHSGGPVWHTYRYVPPRTGYRVFAIHPAALGGDE